MREAGFAIHREGLIEPRLLVAIAIGLSLITAAAAIAIFGALQ